MGRERASFFGLSEASEFYSLWPARSERCSRDSGCLVEEKGAEGKEGRS